MAWITLSATAGGWLAVLDAHVCAVPVSLDTTRGVVSTFLVPTAWVGDYMVPPIKRVNVIQQDVTSVTEYRALTRDTARTAAQDSSLNSIVTDAFGNVASKRTASANRSNEADGWVVRMTHVTSSWWNQEVQA